MDRTGCRHSTEQKDGGLGRPSNLNKKSLRHWNAQVSRLAREFVRQCSHSRRRLSIESIEIEHLCRSIACPDASGCRPTDAVFKRMDGDLSLNLKTMRCHAAKQTWLSKVRMLDRAAISLSCQAHSATSSNLLAALLLRIAAPRGSALQLAPGLPCCLRPLKRQKPERMHPCARPPRQPRGLLSSPWMRSAKLGLGWRQRPAQLPCHAATPRRRAPGQRRAGSPPPGPVPCLLEAQLPRKPRQHLSAELQSAPHRGSLAYPQRRTLARSHAWIRLLVRSLGRHKRARGHTGRHPAGTRS
mmetsp:Transcript_116648/g.277288  ORF Transcript_116648/g.277288 Transcript_116648/m.277288 type:complete len:299 (-) Transcript_116648:353-1249(-)